MAQHDYEIANQTGLSFRLELNNALSAIVTDNSGPVEPTAKFPGMVWRDTSVSPSVLKKRNDTNSAWVTVQTAVGEALSGATSVAAQRAALGLDTSLFSISTSGGTANAITASFSPVITLSNGRTVIVRAGAANTITTPTFSPDGLAAKVIVKGNNLPLVAGDIAGAGHWIEMQFDTVLDKWVLQNPAKGVSVGGGGTGTIPFPCVNYPPYNAVGDGITDDRAAFAAAGAAGDAFFVADGTYKFNSALDVITPIIAFDAAFDTPPGTFLRNTLYLGKRSVTRTIYRGAEEYTATPTTYANLFDEGGFHLNHFTSMGYQQYFFGDSGGRTMQPGFSVNGSFSGYGDVCAFYGNYGVSKHASAASVTGWTGANSATCVGGQIAALTDRCNVYGTEVHLADNANPSVTAIGAVYSFNRNSGSYAYNTLWAGVRVQTMGAQPVDVGFQLAGKAQVGLDFSGVDFEYPFGSPTKCAIALKANDRIYFNVAKKAPPVWHAIQDSPPPESYMTHTGSGFALVTNGVIHYSGSNVQTIMRGGFQLRDLAENILMDFGVSTAGKLYIGNAGYNVQISQVPEFNAQTFTNSAIAGAALALPATPAFYWTIRVDGVNYKIPIYN